MYRLILLVVCVASAAADSEDEMKKCRRLAHPGIMTCCIGMSYPELKADDRKDCMEIPFKPHSCDRDICFGKKRGYVSDDGTLDREAFIKMISEDYKASPTIVEAVKEKCGKGELDSYGPPEICDIRKIKFCVHAQAVSSCKEWDDSGTCAGVKDLVKECAKIYPGDD